MRTNKLKIIRFDNIINNDQNFKFENVLMKWNN